jgi:hypothetical protein
MAIHAPTPLANIANQPQVVGEKEGDLDHYIEEPVPRFGALLADNYHYHQWQWQEGFEDGCVGEVAPSIRLLPRLQSWL